MSFNVPIPSCESDLFVLFPSPACGRGARGEGPGERAHSNQKGDFDRQGRYVLEVPYSDDRELLMDILRHGAAVEVLAPESLREAVKKALGDAAALYL